MALIEGLEVPAVLEFGNQEHIGLRDRIIKRRQLREEGTECPCGESRMECVVKESEKHEGYLQWHCPCGWTGITDRDGG
jgi:hypothetical protein